MSKMTFVIIAYNALNVNFFGHVIKDGFQDVNLLYSPLFVSLQTNISVIGK